jgi:hypothetical protein
MNISMHTPLQCKYTSFILSATYIYYKISKLGEEATMVDYLHFIFIMTGGGGVRHSPTCLFSLLKTPLYHARNQQLSSVHIFV